MAKEVALIKRASPLVRYCESSGYMQKKGSQAGVYCKLRVSQ